MRLQPRVLRLRRQPGALRPQVLAALEAEGRPLRWAITAVERGSGSLPDEVLLTVEALLTVETVVCREDPVQFCGEG
ncbi:hypothetical protein [Cyanobium sp. NIES-981]|uniref:hypothetical protein n=1 Tax=Cyanobium sp. NIES-981 TaxID=1851505 RepID=UPI000B359AFD|nr:hypothetical protein [Cyanobium sp. NIES-981]